MSNQTLHQSLSQPQQGALENECPNRTPDQESAPVSHVECNDDHFLIAYQVSELPLRLEVAPIGRKWMDDTRQGFAKRCLPLLVANQSSWQIVTTVPFQAMWNGGADKSSITVTSPSGKPVPAISHFGSGILTFQLPWLFRTPPDYNLLLRGPVNLPKDGASALEGLIETDWACATATMNWQLTRPGLWVSWEAGEPIASIVPVRRGEIERFTPSIMSIDADPQLKAHYNAWQQSRGAFLRDLGVAGTEAHKAGWERHYMRGRAPGGLSAPVGAHQTKLKLCPFHEGERREAE